MEALKMNETKKFYEALERMGVAAEFEARGIEKGREEGREEGIEKGREEGLRHTATNLKKTGMPLKQIADVTGLPMAKLEGL
jgi:predicted transposase/invertase (TIGR01784 family)